MYSHASRSLIAPRIVRDHAEQVALCIGCLLLDHRAPDLFLERVDRPLQFAQLETARLAVGGEPVRVGERRVELVLGGRAATTSNSRASRSAVSSGPADVVVRQMAAGHFRTGPLEDRVPMCGEKAGDVDGRFHQARLLVAVHPAREAIDRD